MPVFEIKAKADHCGGKIKKGQTFQIVTNYVSCCDAAIADGLEKQLGRWARDAQFVGYWEIRKL